MSKVDSLDELLEIMKDRNLDSGYVFIVKSLHIGEYEDEDGDSVEETYYENQKVFGTLITAVEYASSKEPDDMIKVDCFDLVGEGVVNFYSLKAEQNGITEPVIIIECFKIE